MKTRIRVFFGGECWNWVDGKWRGVSPSLPEAIEEAFRWRKSEVADTSEAIKKIVFSANGKHLVLGTDYTLSGTTLFLNRAITAPSAPSSQD